MASVDTPYIFLILSDAQPDIETVFLTIQFWLTFTKSSRNKSGHKILLLCREELSIKPLFEK